MNRRTSILLLLASVLGFLGGLGGGIIALRNYDHAFDKLTAKEIVIINAKGEETVQLRTHSITIKGGESAFLGLQTGDSLVPDYALDLVVDASGSSLELKTESSDLRQNYNTISMKSLPSEVSLRARAVTNTPDGPVVSKSDLIASSSPSLSLALDKNHSKSSDLLIAEHGTIAIYKDIRIQASADMSDDELSDKISEAYDNALQVSLGLNRDAKPALHLYLDGQTRLIAGAGSVEFPSGVSITRPPNSLMLFDKTGKLRWSTPQ